MICARASINADTGASLFYISFAEAEYFQPCNALAQTAILKIYQAMLKFYMD